MNLPIQALEEQVGDEALEWAYSNREGDRATQFRRRAVAGGDRVIWQVEVIDGAGKQRVKSVLLELEAGAIVEATCTCKSKREPICRHAVLAAWALEGAVRNGKVTNVEAKSVSEPAEKPKKKTTRKLRWSYANMVEDLPIQEMQQWMVEWMAIDPKVKVSLHLRFGGSDPKESVARYGATIKPALRASGGAAKRLSTTNGKAVLRAFDAYLNEVDRHFAADRFATGSRVLLALVEQARPWIAKVQEKSGNFDGFWRRVLTLAVRSSGLTVDRDQRSEITANWVSAASTTYEEYPHIQAQLAIAALSLRPEDELQLPDFERPVCDLIDGFVAYCEGDLPEAEEAWKGLNNNMFVLQWVIPFMIFESDWTFAERWAREIIANCHYITWADEPMEAVGWRLLHEVALASANEELQLDALVGLVAWDKSKRLNHFQTFRVAADEARFEQLEEVLRHALPFETAKHFVPLVEMLLQAGRTRCVVDLAFAAVKNQILSIADLFPHADQLQPLLQNMWTDFIKAEVLDVLPTASFNVREEQRLLNLLTRLKRDVSAEELRMFKVEFHEQTRYPYMIDRLFYGL